jgi:hypothetical protein
MNDKNHYVADNKLKALVGSQVFSTREVNICVAVVNPPYIRLIDQLQKAVSAGVQKPVKAPVKYAVDPSLTGIVVDADNKRKALAQVKCLFFHVTLNT